MSPWAVRWARSYHDVDVCKRSGSLQRNPERRRPAALALPARLSMLQIQQRATHKTGQQPRRKKKWDKHLQIWNVSWHAPRTLLCLRCTTLPSVVGVWDLAPGCGTISQPSVWTLQLSTATSLPAAHDSSTNHAGQLHAHKLHESLRRLPCPGPPSLRSGNDCTTFQRLCTQTARF